ncbi:MAG: hypothetical protein M0R06_00110 [Sphaerochaeta sp.]|jgi:hypothetical protein|nr:hypothetical protein [Sphaerochaeta sp.]
MSRTTKLPVIPLIKNVPADVARYLNIFKAILDVFKGDTGDELDRVVTFRDLANGEANLADLGDVQVSNLQDWDVLVYDSHLQKWVNKETLKGQ